MTAGRHIPEAACAALLALALFGCGRPERPIATPAPQDAGAFSAVVVVPRTLSFELRGSDFEDARGRGCPLEAIVEEPDAGQSPTLRLRCAVYGGP